MTRPLVSVVMPSFNQARFIDEAIESVLTQDYDAVELIVADGGSTDGTSRRLAEAAGRDARLRWWSRPDDGPAFALNAAIRAARGTLIGWLNSDDLYAPGALTRMAALFEADPALMLAYGEARHIDAGGGDLGPYPTLRPEVGRARFSAGCFVCQPTVVFKAVMPHLIGDLDERLSASFDLDYWLRAFGAFEGRIGFADAVIARSRLHDACITQRQRRTVAVEGIRVTARHLGRASSHWMTTYLEEALGEGDAPGDLTDAVEAVADLLPPSELAPLRALARRGPS